MITPFPAAGRGATRAAGLDSRHAFSFGRYYDPQRLGFGALRVLNEDRLAPGAGLLPHRHANMEILVWVAAGDIDFVESSGRRLPLRAGGLLRVSAGAGVEYSLLNPSAENSAHLLQLWIQPDRVNAAAAVDLLEPSDAGQDGLRLLASRDGRDGSLPLRQDANLYAAALAPGECAARRFAPGRRVWLQVVCGQVALGEHRLAAGDAAAIEPADELVITAADAACLLLLDLA